jgi:hypothetical protein
MIDKFNLAKALLDNSEVISVANSYLLIPDGEAYASNPNETFIQEKTLYGPDNSVGLSDDSSDFQIGLYQVTINTPKAQEGGKWSGLQIAGVFQAGFNKGLELTFGGQMLRIKNATIEGMDENDTHFIHILSITFSVIN